jgi:trans-aconitate 2-methyltransferase
MTTWNPEQYLAFSSPRQRAALDLLDRVPPIEPEWIYDLGCGTGHITRVIAERWPEAQVVGIDNSPDMLDVAHSHEFKARREVNTAADADGSAEQRKQPRPIEWREADVTTWSPPEPADLIYSNAALHWLPEHPQLFPRLIEQLRPGGVLALQMPLSWYAPSHRLMREVLASGGPDGEALGDEALRRSLAAPPVMSAGEYYDLIAPLVERVDIWTTEYLHILEGKHPVFDWVAGTGLRPILQALEGTDRERFLFGYRDKVRAEYPQNMHGQTLYPFPRLFIVATF